MPPSPTLRVPPTSANAPAVLLNVMLRVFSATFTTGLSFTDPPKTRSVAVRLLTGAVLSAQFNPVVIKLSPAPPLGELPSHVSVTAELRVRVVSSVIPQATMQNGAFIRGRGRRMAGGNSTGGPVLMP